MSLHANLTQLQNPPYMKNIEVLDTKEKLREHIKEHLPHYRFCDIRGMVEEFKAREEVEVLSW